MRIGGCKMVSVTGYKFISLEGVDGSGKTTIASMLEKELKSQGIRCVKFREPGGNLIAEKIRDILLAKELVEMCSTTELLLYAAARSQLVNTSIKEYLDSGGLIIADRYVDSTTAYQGYGRGIDLELIKTINNIATDGVMPDKTIVLDLEPSIAEQRLSGSKDRLELAGLEFFNRVRDGYLQIARDESPRTVLIDASQPLRDVFNAVLLELGVN